MMNKPLVSVIITTKNNERTIGSLLKSIAQQTYKPVEVIVVDNKSNDRTLQIAKSYKALCITKGPERSAQRNAGLKKSKGEYVLILDSDMELSRNVVSDCVSTIQKNKNIHALNIPEESFGEGFWAECKKLERSFYMGSNNVEWMQGARFFRRTSIIQMNGYDEDNTGTEDFDLPQRIKHAYGERSIKTIKSLIYHDEGRLSLLNTLKKKYYYAKRLRSYFSKQENREYFNKQSNILLRYKLFFSHPEKLLKKPMLSAGLFILKFAEFLSGGVGFFLANNINSESHKKTIKGQNILFCVSAMYTSGPNTMGGNTKILIELINKLNHKYHVVIYTSEPVTFLRNITRTNVEIITLKLDHKFSYLHHFEEIFKIYFLYRKHLLANNRFRRIYFYSASDFAADVVPLFLLKLSFQFEWIASMFLFVPNPIENIRNNYGFPKVKYIIYYLYQRSMYLLMLIKANCFFITNDFDKAYFPKNKRNLTFAVYGGVNIELLQPVRTKKMFDAIFCGRLHPQKGLTDLIDIWKLVVNRIPEAQLGIIGNGDPYYEQLLKVKVRNLSLTNNIAFLGYVNGHKKYQIYSKSKIFTHSTIYDNNGMVAAEALCAGLPVIMYDLPQLKTVYKVGCVKIKYRDHRAYSNVIVKMILDKKYYSNLLPSQSQLAYIRSFWDWNNRFKMIFNHLDLE